MEGVASEVTEMDDLYLNFPQTKNLAVGVLFGYLAKGEIALQLDVPNRKNTVQIAHKKIHVVGKF